MCLSLAAVRSVSSGHVERLPDGVRSANTAKPALSSSASCSDTAAPVPSAPAMCTLFHVAVPSMLHMITIVLCTFALYYIASSLLKPSNLNNIG